MGLAAVILAAGQGTRMKSRYSKVLHAVAGRAMLRYVLQAAVGAGAERVVVVAGYEAPAVAESVAGEAEVVIQKEQLGTAHALLQTENVLKSFGGDIMVLPGDTPLLCSGTLRDFYSAHVKEGAAATVLTACFSEPAGYGRVIRDAGGKVERIVEHRDATKEELLVHEVNTGVYCFRPGIFDILRKISPDNVQREYYLPDAVRLLREEGSPVAAWEAADPEEFFGINDRRQLAVAERIIRQRVVDALMDAGVTVVDPAVTYVDPGVTVGADTVIYPFTFLEGNTVIGSDARIGPWARIIDSRLGDYVVVQSAVVIGSAVADRAVLGPYTYIRPGTDVGPGAKVGGFVEVKKSVIGEGSKVPHLSYIGDTEIGSNVNVGAGTITCNYDGLQKWLTVIEDDAFIGSNTNLVAPVKIGKGAYIGAGSTITKDVPPYSLGIARGRQTNIPEWAKKKPESEGKE
ncbi:MAG TPA: bifunctional UDP-N-acetylglucosamine diphosphorylase/glucosamine-1-phosphate N-acetyltransferase GlmU [Desulfotomaculum sp.]|nr:bifunctional UDP-N-acetylglucosamine diphosphorylase/glucosamine-1-phosphate N-acetyltransferase GlmU [Desulfotomaculum sp.]